MATRDDSAGRAAPHRLPLLLLMPIWLVVVPCAILLFGGLGLVAVTFNFIGEVSFRARLRRSARFLRPIDARFRIAAEGGTLIVEQPSPGWGYTRLWWTPDNVVSQSPYSQPTDEEYKAAGECCLEWDRWCYENYVDPDRGRAWLLGVWNGTAHARKLTKMFPAVTMVRTWSAWVHFPEEAGDDEAVAEMDVDIDATTKFVE